MTKADIIENLRLLNGLKKIEAETIFESFLDIVKNTLSSGEEVKVSGFGKFAIHQKKERVGRNPQTGVVLKISGRKVVTFKASPVFKNSINSQ